MRCMKATKLFSLLGANATKKKDFSKSEQFVQILKNGYILKLCLLFEVLYIRFWLRKVFFGLEAFGNYLVRNSTNGTCGDNIS